MITKHAKSVTEVTPFLTPSQYWPKRSDKHTKYLGLANENLLLRGPVLSIIYLTRFISKRLPSLIFSWRKLSISFFFLQIIARQIYTWQTAML